MNQDALHAVAVLRGQHECTYTSVCIGCAAIDVLRGEIAQIHGNSEQGCKCEDSLDHCATCGVELAGEHDCDTATPWAEARSHRLQKALDQLLILETFYGKSRPR